MMPMVDAGRWRWTCRRWPLVLAALMVAADAGH